MSKNNKYDIIIAGGGVIGHSVAYQLSKGKNFKIAIIDKYKVGKATWASCGGLWATGESVGLGCGVIFFRTFSAQKARDKEFDFSKANPHFMPKYFLEYADKSNELFAQFKEELDALHDTSMGYRYTGLSFIIYDEADMHYAKNIYETVKEYNPELVEMLDKQQLREMEPYVTDNAMGGLFFPKDNDVNPYGLEFAYRHANRINGVSLIEGSEVVDVGMQSGKVTSVLTNKSETYYCDTLINAAGAWAAEIGQMIDVVLPVKPIKGQIILSEQLPPILHSCLSTSDCYIDQKEHGEILIGATTEDLGFHTRTEVQKLATLAAGAVRAVPELENLHIKRTWAGLRPATPDEIPIFGPIDGIDGYLNAIGNFRTGIVTAPITGEILKSFVCGTKPPVDTTPFLYERFASGKVAMDAKASYIPPE